MMDALMLVARFAIVLPIVLIGVIGWTSKNHPDWFWQVPLLLIAIMIVGTILALIVVTHRMCKDLQRQEREETQRHADEHCYKALRPPE